MASKPRCPGAILDAIPWYPSGLSETERGAVEAHAADCVACRNELGFVLGAELPGGDVPDPDRVFARVLDRIEKGPPRPRSARAEFLTRAASLLLAALVGSVVGWASVELRPRSWTLKAVEEEVVRARMPDEMVLDLVFHDHASAEEIRGALRALGARIVAGPDEAGVYTVRLAPDTDAVAAREQIESATRGVADLIGYEDL